MNEPSSPATRSEGSGSLVARNTVLFAFGSTAGLVITLVLTPILIEHLGATGYGVWILATSLTFALGYLSLADLGVEAAVVRFVALARAERDLARQRAVVTAGFGVLATISLFLAVALFALSGPLVGLFDIPGHYHDDAVLAFRLVSLQVVFDLPGRTFTGFLQGAQRYGRWQALEVARATLTTGALLPVVLTGGGIVAMAVASLGVSAGMFVLVAVVALGAERSAVPRPGAFDRHVARTMAGYSGQVLVFRFSGLVYRQTDRTIVGIVLGAATVTSLEIAMRVQGLAAMVATMAASAVTPAAAFSTADHARLRELLLRGTNYALAATLPVVVALFVFSEDIIRTWIGEGYTSSSGPTRVLLAVLVLSTAVGVGQSVLVGLGRLRGMIWCNLVWMALNIALSIVLAGRWGLSGVVVATLISEIVVMGPLVWVMLRNVDVPLMTWLQQAIVPNVPGIVLQVAISIALVRVADSSGSIVVVVVLTGVSALVGWVAYVFLGLRRPARAELWMLLRSALRRSPARSPQTPSSSTTTSSSRRTSV